MLPYFTEHFNPAPRATSGVEGAGGGGGGPARRGGSSASAREVIFTSGATESNNLALEGIAETAPASRRHLVVSAIEHKSVLEAARRLQRDGWRLSIVPVKRDGLLDLDALGAAIADDTALVSVMAANNEIGVIQPLAEVVALAHARGGLVHADAAQAVGKIGIDVTALGIDLLSLTGHKMYGPKGCGALYVRKRTDLAPLIRGGGQERGLRSGTLNVPGIVGLGRACQICRDEWRTEGARLLALRDRLLAGLTAELDGVTVNGSVHEHERLPQNFTSISRISTAAPPIGISAISPCRQARLAVRRRKHRRTSCRRLLWRRAGARCVH
jgi:cysteine desulfurase